MSLCNDSFISRTNDSFGHSEERKSPHRHFKVRVELIRPVLTKSKLSSFDRSRDFKHRLKMTEMDRFRAGNILTEKGRTTSELI